MTIKEIARHTGLSIPTIGNVLGQSGGRYSAQTRARVMKAAQELGYRPNASARAMRRGRIGCAALVLSRSHQQTHSHIPAGLLDGIDDELSLHDMHLTISRLSDEELSEANCLPKVLREFMADGMIVNYTHEIPPAMLDAINAHHTPAVWLNAKLAECCVYPDDYNAAKRATADLIGLGHRRIALVHLILPGCYGGTFEQGIARQHYSVIDRADGFRSAMAEAGLTPRVAHHDRFVSEPDHLAVCRVLLAGPDRPTAVIIYSEQDASVLMAAAAGLGLAVPRDLSVLVFSPMEHWVGGHHVSAIELPTAEVGRRAVRMLLRKTASFPEETCPAEPVPYEAVFRETVAPPAQVTARG